MAVPPRDLLVVGLGNPGERYEGTRHNVGADAVEVLARRHGARLRPDRKVSARVADVRLGGRRVVLAVPTTWMNDSGQAVGALVRRLDLADHLDDVVVVHDELDLPPGRLKLKAGGGTAGHNGLRSLQSHLHGTGFVRVRIGVGKPPGGPERGADWVLSKVRGTAREELAVTVEQAADAVELVAEQGTDAAMQQVNARP